MFRPADDRDVILDGLALIEAAHAGDWEGARTIITYCRPDAVAVFLARVAADVVEQTALDADDVLAYLRERHAAGGPS